ncbi:hypothetical protein [Anoxybacillus flavithermus]|uniref:Uncharacterized protein n=1 Tax=Anoxybacillus flavithermus TaxID=33934 RepID=A0A178TQV8_9BACL|nr:hypothetical protein [Anoxybacillus flavithermus]OAO82581.1 hypothetical protein TAF16_0201 [Anoxybacillus flavithermus]
MGLQFGIKEVYNLNIVDFATNKPFIYVDYAEATTNENTAERTSLKGGQGYYKLMDFDHSKESTLKLTVPLVDIKLLAMLAGDDLVEGATSVFKREELTVTYLEDNMGIILSETPIDEDTDTVVVHKLEGLRDYGKEVTVSNVEGKNVELTGVDDGEKVVVFYQYSSPATAKKFSIKANKFPKTVKIFGDGLWRDQETGMDKAVKMMIHKAKPQANFTLTTSGSDVTTLEITFDLYPIKDADGDMSYIDYVVL